MAHAKLWTSARYYYEAAHRHGSPHSRHRRRVSDGLAVFLKEVVLQPKRWHNATIICRLEVFPSVDILRHEEPQVLAADIAAFFRTLR